MTMPGGPGGLESGAWLAEWVNRNDLSGLAGRDEGSIRAYFEALVKQSTGWLDADNTFFSVILGGFANLGEFVSLLVQVFTGSPGSLASLGSFMADRWADLGAAFTAIGDLAEQLLDKLGINDLVLATQGLYEGDNEGIQFVNNLFTFLGNALSGFFDFTQSVSGLFGKDGWEELVEAAEGGPEALWSSVVTLFIAPLKAFLTELSPLNAARLFGAILPPQLQQVSLFSIGDTQPNLLTEADFRDVVTIDGGGFVWDGTDGRTMPGCAKVLCNGEDHTVISLPVPVSKDQTLDVGAFVSYAGVGGSGSIRVELATFWNGAQVNTVLIGSVSPSGSSTDWSSKISGSYVVPDGVDAVGVQLHVTSDATAGVAKFDDAWLKKQQLLKLPYVDGLVAKVTEFTDRIAGIIDSIFNAFNNLGEWVDTNNPLSSVIDAVLGLLVVSTGAQSGVSAHEARIRALESSANTIVFDFNGSSGLPSGVVVTSAGGGAGGMGKNGKGALVWVPSGSGNRTQIGRYDGQVLTTDCMVLEWVLSSTPQSYVFDDAYTYVCARMAASGFGDYLRLRSGFDSVRVQSVVGGSVSNVGGVWSGRPQAGDVFRWEIGEPGGLNKRHHVLKRNGGVILDFTEAVSSVGAGFLKVGYGMETGNRLVFTQNIPAGLAVLTATEVL